MVKNPPSNAGDAGDLGLIPGLGRSPGEGNGNPLQYSCLESSIDRGAWWATARGVTEELAPTERLSHFSSQEIKLLVQVHLASKCKAKVCFPSLLISHMSKPEKELGNLLEYRSG